MTGGEGLISHFLLNYITSPYGCGVQYHAFDFSSCAAIIRCCSFAKRIYHKRDAFMDERDTEAENPHSESKLTPKCILI